MRIRAVGLGLVVLACVALAACGEDEKQRLTAEQLTTQGDAVCVKLDSDVKDLADTLPVSITFTPEQMQDFYKQIVPLLDQAVLRFKKLAPPEDLEAVYESALTQMEIDRKTLVGATSSPAAAKNLFDTRVDPFTATGQKLAAAGITACGGTAPSVRKPEGSGSSPTTAGTVTTKPEAGSSPTTAGTATTAR